jgi:hypothetical protein
MSDKPKHTPGPWEWCETKTGLYGPDYPIIDTDRDWGMFLHPTNLEANARLISAAPELLEALEAIVAFDTPLPCGLLKQASAAIAKAKL